MAKGRREAKSAEQKMRDLDENFVEEVLALSPEKLNEKLVNLTKYRIELEDAKENDVDLKQAQEQAKEAGAQYSEGFKAIKMKQKYIFNLLGNQGVSSDSTERATKELARQMKGLKKSLGDDSEITISVNGGKEVSL